MDDRDINDLEQRIRERAFHLWLDEGRPDGRADAHWQLARELVAIEDNEADTRIPVGTLQPSEPVEPIAALENAGEFPTMTDQGEMQIPARPEPQPGSGTVSSVPPRRPARAAQSR